VASSNALVAFVISKILMARWFHRLKLQSATPRKITQFSKKIQFQDVTFSIKQSFA
jgi:hypothetical protein